MGIRGGETEEEAEGEREGINHRTEFKTVVLEYGRGGWNFRWRGTIRKDKGEYSLVRRPVRT